MSLPDGVDERLRALIVERALSRPGLVPSPAAAEAVLTINGEEIPIRPGAVAFGFGEGQRVVEPSEEFRERFRSFYEEMWRIHGCPPAQLALGIPYPPPRTIEQGAPPIPDDLRERLVESIVQRAVGSVEFRDGFFDDPEDESAVD